MTANSTILRLGRVLIMGWCMVSLSLSVRAAEIKVLSGGAMEPALVAAAAAFGKESAFLPSNATTANGIQYMQCPSDPAAAVYHAASSG